MICRSPRVKEQIIWSLPWPSAALSACKHHLQIRLRLAPPPYLPARRACASRPFCATPLFIGHGSRAVRHRSARGKSPHIYTVYYSSFFTLSNICQCGCTCVAAVSCGSHRDRFARAYCRRVRARHCRRQCERQIRVPAPSYPRAVAAGMDHIHHAAGENLVLHCTCVRRPDIDARATPPAPPCLHANSRHHGHMRGS